MRMIILAFVTALLAACTPSKLEETALTPQERTLVRSAIQDVALNDTGKLAAKVTPEIAPKLSGALPAMRAALPEPPFELSMTNANWNIIGPVRRVHAVYQLKGKSGWALVEASIESSGGRSHLTGLYVQRTAGDPATLSAFSLSNAGAGGWIMLAAMLAAFGVTIAALIRIWRSGKFSKRWLWTIGALIGVTTLRLNWSTGAWNFQPISIQLFSVSALKQPVFAPWVLAVSIPVVALFALFYRGHGWENHDPGADTVADTAPASEDS